MDLDAILKGLRENLERLNISIRALEDMELSAPRKRGRPRKWFNEVKPEKPKKRGRPAT